MANFNSERNVQKNGIGRSPENPHDNMKPVSALSLL